MPTDVYAAVLRFGLERLERHRARLSAAGEPVRGRNLSFAITPEPIRTRNLHGQRSPLSPDGDDQVPGHAARQVGDDPPGAMLAADDASEGTPLPPCRAARTLSERRPVLDAQQPTERLIVQPPEGRGTDRPQRDQERVPGRTASCPARARGPGDGGRRPPRWADGPAAGGPESRLPGRLLRLAPGVHRRGTRRRARPRATLPRRDRTTAAGRVRLPNELTLARETRDSRFA
jgi:hypothetical protein